ncbi:MAG: DciA family protein [Alphaproteobacteria bacterium]|nr:DciA family protein [Alphaproteobacteria bacterium]
MAASVGGIAKRSLGRRGFAEGGLIADWRAVVGPELAASCWPDRLSFPPGKKEGGMLRIRAAGGIAMELQHLAPQVLERVNGHFGYRAIARITILQAPPDAAAAPQRAARARPDKRPDPAQQSDLEAVLSEVEDPEVRAALARLGRAMISDGRTE